jgi:hypothetical protein
MWGILWWKNHQSSMPRKTPAYRTLTVDQRSVKEWYSTAEVAKLLDKAEFTVREWCRLGRVKAQKKKCGRGIASEWMISHAELTRVRNEGLLPEPRPYRHVK